MDHKPRTFSINAAKRERVPVLIGLIGPSGSGKTKSALRLATGMSRVTGGRIGVIDTEANRSKHYAPKNGQAANPPETFDFDHLEFKAPFSPLDYLDAIKSMVATGVTTVIVDSASHEHEGPGGVLEWHDNLANELAKRWNISFEKAQMSAWGEPKAARRRLLNEIVQMPINVILCFRAKEKLEIITGKQPVQLGWMPIAGDEFVYEMTANMLLPPNGHGVPRLLPSMEGEKQMAKMPDYFETMITAGKQIDEVMGEAMAKWAAGDVAKLAGTPAPGKVVARLVELSSGAENAEARIIARDIDDAALIAVGKRIKAKESTFDAEFPPVGEPRIPGEEG